MKPLLKALIEVKNQKQIQIGAYANIETKKKTKKPYGSQINPTHEE